MIVITAISSLCEREGMNVTLSSWSWSAGVQNFTDLSENKCFLHVGFFME